MIKFKLVDRRTKVHRRIEALKEQLEELPKEFMRTTVDEIIEYSPVDTGTYMDAHNIGTTRGATSSFGKPQNQDYQTYAESARERLYSQIAALGPEVTKHYISNNSLHAWKVEYELGYAPYSSARRTAQTLLDKAIAKVMGT